MMGLFEYYGCVAYSRRSHQRGQVMLGLGDPMTKSSRCWSSIRLSWCRFEGGCGGVGEGLAVAWVVACFWVL